MKNLRLISTLTVFAMASLAACSAKPAVPAPAANVAPVPTSAALQPEASHAALDNQATAEGTVAETMDAANYTYVRVKTASGELWAATSTFKVAVGDKVVVPLDNPMANFHSQSLKRDFPLIYFASSIAHEGEALAAAAVAAVPGHAPSAGGAAPQVTEPIPPAPGGVTVASIVTNRKTLAGKTVTVRGKVVKYNGAILGFNWIHIQDGSGTAKDGTNDITVTSTDTAALGDIVTITGTVVLDKDFGSGYSYAVLLQNARVVVK